MEPDITAISSQDDVGHLAPSTSDGILRLCLHPVLKAVSQQGTSVLPKSRKARALLALVALSDSRTISRARAAAMLWSNLERATALARLRNTLHHLQQDFAAAGVEPFRIDDQAIALRPETVRIDNDQGPVGGEAPFLLELEGIDPGFDRWLTRVRDERLLRRAPPEPNGIQDGTTSETGGRVHRGGDERPTLAVAEVETIGIAVEQAFALAFTEEVGNALARMRWFKTVTRGRQGKRLVAGHDDISGIADYLLIGTLQCDGGHYRLLLKLLDANNSADIVWVEGFEEPVGTSFEIQRKLANIVAARVDRDLLLIEVERRRRAPLPKNDPYGLVLLAIPAIYRLDRDHFLGAGHALEEAVAADAEFGFAYSWLAYWNLFLIGQGWAINPFQSMQQAGKAAERAMMLDPRDARAITIAGHVKAYLGRQLDEAAALHQVAIQTNPALALAWHLYSVTHAYAGRLDEALRCITHCLDLAPGDPHGFYAEGALSIVQLLRGNYETAAEIGRRVTERHPQFSSAYKSYLAALGHLGRKVEAAGVLQRLHALEPRFSLQRFRASAHYRRPEDLERFLTGLRLAGAT